MQIIFFLSDDDKKILHASQRKNIFSQSKKIEGNNRRKIEGKKSVQFHQPEAVTLRCL